MAKYKHQRRIKKIFMAYWFYIFKRNCQNIFVQITFKLAVSTEFNSNNENICTPGVYLYMVYSKCKGAKRQCKYGCSLLIKGDSMLIFVLKQKGTVFSKRQRLVN